jgi:hypothetical protein
VDLAPGETREVRLYVTPARAGETLQVLGLSWRLFGLGPAVSFRFERKGLPLNVRVLR